MYSVKTIKLKNGCAWQRSLIRLGTEMFPAAYASTIRASICKDIDSDQE